MILCSLPLLYKSQIYSVIWLMCNMISIFFFHFLNNCVFMKIVFVIIMIVAWWLKRVPKANKNLETLKPWGILSLRIKSNMGKFPDKIQ